MDKLDLKKEYKELYKPSAKKVSLVDVPAFRFLMVNSEDARIEGPNFQTAIQALFPVAYKTKFLCKKELGRDYGVMPLEGLWWADDMEDFIKGNKKNWKYTLMIHQPEFITVDLINEAIAVTRKKLENPFLNDLYLEEYREGSAAQILHIGPFSEEHGNILKLHKCIEETGGKYNGQQKKHHEIYLSDFRRTTPEKLRTVLRQPYTA